MNKMTLEMEMELWRRRSESAFGRKLKEIIDYTKDFFCVDVDEYGLKYTPVSSLLTVYSLDGEEFPIYKNLVSILENYDMGVLKREEGWTFTSHHKKLGILVSELRLLAL